MPHPPATVLHVSPSQQDILQHVVRRTTSPQRLVTRARIILAAAAGTSNSQMAKQVQVHEETVQRWRNRWGAAESRLQAIEATGQPKLLRQVIAALVTDEPRPGAPASFTFEQFMQIIALACERPAAADRKVEQLDPARTGRRSDQRRHRADDFCPHGGTFFKR